MNSTKWPSLTEFAKHLGKEGMCRVEETDKGIHIAWIDNSPDALRRQEALRKKEAQDQGDDLLEQRIIKEQIRRAQANAAKDKPDQEDEDRELKRQDGEKIKLSFGAKPKPQPEESRLRTTDELPKETSTEPDKTGEAEKTGGESEKPEPKPGFGGMSMKLGGKPQAKNVFAQAKKNALAGGPKKSGKIEHPKKMSEAERIMREEMDKKRSRESAGFGFGMPNKKPRN